MLLKTLASLAALILVVGAIIFAAAGTTDYWQAWLFLACYFAASLVVSFWLARNDTALLERRMRGGPFAEGERSQKIIMAITSLGFVALLVVPGLDRRFGWSSMPGFVAILGDLLLLLGWLGILAVFRHPMYAAALLMLLGIPIALGSWWGALVLLALIPALGWRLIDEERLLLRDLDGYAEYRRKVRWRLIPYIW